MRVLHLISSGGMYGAEAVILNLSAAINAQPEHRSLLGVFANQPHPSLQLHEAALRQGVESHILPCHGQFDRGMPARIRKLAAETGADIVHTHGYKADLYAWLALRGSSLPLVATCHNWIDNTLSVRAYGTLDRLALRRFRRVVAVSNKVRDRLVTSGVARAKTQVIRNGVDLRPYENILRPRPSSDGTLAVGFAGRLSHEKGADLFVRAAAVVVQQAPSARFVLAGDGPAREELQDLISTLGLTGHVTLAGPQADMPAFYGSLDLLVLSSRTEGLPMTLLEGMASGLPVIATSVGEVPAVLESAHASDQPGRLIAPEDLDQLSNTIVQLLHDSDLRRSMGQLARSHIIAEFSAQRMAAEYIEVYAAASSAAHAV